MEENMCKVVFWVLITFLVIGLVFMLVVNYIFCVLWKFCVVK